MNIKFYLLTGFILTVFPIFLSAQEKLDRDLIMFRVNDTIVKQQVEYKDPGRIGANVLWDFSQLNTVDKEYELIYTNDKNSTIVGIEHRTRYYYQLINDSLFLLGFENPTTKIINSQPELLMSFPLTYQKSTFAYYYGEGEYSKQLDIVAKGSIKTKVDAYGTIILPNKDTLRNVVRLKTDKLITKHIKSINTGKVLNKKRRLDVSNKAIRYDLEKDPSVILVRNYKWFAAGYRYPIFETVQTRKYKDHSKSPSFSTAFFYPPHEHHYLYNDLKNRQLQNRLLAKKENKKEDKEPLKFSYNIFPNPVHSQLTIEYYISKEAKVAYTVYNLSGQIVSMSPAKNKKNGVYRETINMDYCVQGEYLLKIEVNNKTYSEKVIKN